MIGRHRSTVEREIKRHSGRYRPEPAQRKAVARHEGKDKHEAFTPAIMNFVADRLKKDYGPEQIKGRADRDNDPCVSPERI